MNLIVVELCADTCPVGKQLQLHALWQLDSYNLVGYVAVEIDAAMLADEAPMAQNLGLSSKTAAGAAVAAAAGVMMAVTGT